MTFENKLYRYFWNVRELLTWYDYFSGRQPRIPPTFADIWWKSRYFRGCFLADYRGSNSRHLRTGDKPTPPSGHVRKKYLFTPYLSILEDTCLSNALDRTLSHTKEINIERGWIEILHLISIMKIIIIIEIMIKMIWQKWCKHIFYKESYTPWPGYLKKDLLRSHFTHVTIYKYTILYTTYPPPFGFYPCDVIR